MKYYLNCSKRHVIQEKIIPSSPEVNGAISLWWQLLSFLKDCTYKSIILSILYLLKTFSLNSNWKHELTQAIVTYSELSPFLDRFLSIMITGNPQFGQKLIFLSSAIRYKNSSPSSLYNCFSLFKNSWINLFLFSSSFITLFDKISPYSYIY